MRWGWDMRWGVRVSFLLTLTRPHLHACVLACLRHLRTQISKTYTHYAATALFFFFGIKSLYDAFFKKDDVSGTIPSVFAGVTCVCWRDIRSCDLLPLVIPL